MRSLFIGIYIFLLWLPLAPFTALWMLGERVQGRSPKWSVHWRYEDELSAKAVCLIITAILFGIAYISAIVYSIV